MRLLKEAAQSKTFDWQPLPRQREALDTPAFETLYGGAAGGGKSDLLLALARLQHKSVLLLRRTFPDLERSLIERSTQLYGVREAFNAGKHVWRIADQRIEFGHLEYDKDVHQYQSAQYDLIGFDELTQFTRSQYEYMLSRVRTIRRNQRVRAVGCTNPGGEGNEWVMERWAPWLDDTHPRPAVSGEVRYFKRNAEGRDVETDAADPDGLSRTFIAARLADNPYLGDDYRRQLNALPEPYRSQLLNGDWQAGLTDDAYQVIPRAWVKAAMARWKNDGRPTDAQGNPVPLSIVGVDVARGGDDQTVLARRYDNWYAPLERHAGRTTPDGPSVVPFVMLALQDGGEANIDVIGVGSSVYDTARDRDLNVAGINWSEGTKARDKSGQLGFINKRAEHWWQMREALDPEGGQNLALPDDPELLSDLCAPRWSVQSNGIKIESKEDIKKRIGRSPDCGDAVVLANAEQTLQLFL